MATKYAIYGAAFEGDGTSSSEAASNGAAGAWKMDQAAGSIIEGNAPTYGTLAAGDIVNVRSKTGNGANANISVTLGAAKTFGSASGSSTAPITWVLDDGTVWSGVNGTLTYTYSGSSTFTSTFRQYNKFVARTALNWIHSYTSTGPAGTALFTIHEDASLVGLKLDVSANTGTSGPTISHSGLMERCQIRWGRIGVSGYYIFAPVSYVGPQLIDTEIELTNATVSGAVFGLANGNPSSMTVIGGRIFGTGATTGQAVFTGEGTTANSQYLLLGMDYPKTMNLYAQNYRSARFSAMGMDGGLGGAIVEPWGTADSRTDGYYPTLNATLPNSTSQGWSWKLYPASVQKATPARHMRMTVAKLYQSAAAAKTVTLELLIADTISTADQSTLWMTVSYVDNSTGVRTTQTTEVLTGGSLTTSTASWSATTWGAVNLLKRKLSLTTSGSIKQDTMVLVTLRGTVVSGSANDIMFMCPDVQLT